MYTGCAIVAEPAFVDLPTAKRAPGGFNAASGVASSEQVGLYLYSKATTE